MPPKKSSKPASNTKSSVKGQKSPGTNPRDTFRVGNTWMIRLAGGKHVRVPMLHEEFPGGKEVSQRLLSASSRARALIQGAKQTPLSPNEVLGIETERAHFRFNKIINESRMLRDKGLIAQSRDNLVHARKLLDDINDQREKLRLPPLTPREFMSFQRPLTQEESLKLLVKGGKKFDNQKVKRRMVRTLRAPEEKIIQLLHARVEQYNRGIVKLRIQDQREITRILALPAEKLLYVMRERVKQLIIFEEAELKKPKRSNNPAKTTIQQLAELPERFAKLPATARKDALTLLQIAKKGLELEREMWKKGKTAQARAALKVYDDALRTFGEILPK